MDHLIALTFQLPTLEEIVRWGGYAGLFFIIFAETGLLIGFFLPGDSLLVTAGLFAARGELKATLSDGGQAYTDTSLFNSGNGWPANRASARSSRALENSLSAASIASVTPSV